MGSFVIVSAVCATFLYLLWLICKVKNENRELLKEQEELLLKIEERQNERFDVLEKGQQKLAKIMYKLDLEEREGFKTLTEISKKTVEGNNKKADVTSQ